MVRKIVAVVLGVVVLGAVVMSLQQLGAALYPLPVGVDPMDPADATAFAEHVAGMPALVWVLALLSEIVGTGCGALVAGVIARDSIRGVTGALVGLGTVGSVTNWVAFPHPAWFMVTQLVLYPATLVAVWMLLESRRPKETDDPTA